MGRDLRFAIAHRGTSSITPENAGAAAIKAHTLVCRWIEVDQLLTADDVPIVIHDHTLERTENEYAAIAAATVA